MRRAVGLVLYVTLVTFAPACDLAAQTDISIGAGVGTVRSSDSPPFGAVTLAPAFRWTAPAAFVALQSTVAALPDGQWNIQLHWDLWTRVAGRGHRGLALAPAFAGTALPGGARAGSAQLLAEMFQGSGVQGIGLAAGTLLGALAGTKAVAAPRARARLWKQTDLVQYALTIEPTGLRGEWFTDVSASATLERARLVATISATGRVLSDWRSSGTGGLFAAWRLTDRVALEGSASGFLPDPFLGFPRAWTVGVAVRIRWGSRPGRLTLPIVAQWRGDSIVVRVRLGGTGSVALAGEWNGWVPMALRQVRTGLWEGSLSLTPGTYRFSLVVDGTRWLVPAGVAAVPDGFGGTTGLLVVPPNPAAQRR